MDLGKRYILENKLQELKTLLREKYINADPEKTEIVLYTEDLMGEWEQIDELEYSKVRDVENLCDYAVDTKREEALKLVLGLFKWINVDAIITRILRNGLHTYFDDFLKSRLSLDFKFPSLIRKLMFLYNKDSATPSIDGLETLFNYIPTSLQEFYAVVAIGQIDTPFLGHLQRLDTLLSRYVSNHCIFEKHILGIVKSAYMDDTSMVFKFIVQTPQYKWVDDDGNGFYHYAAQNRRNVNVFV
jgi:hypothetical protein